jgi:hypothetical protein
MPTRFPKLQNKANQYQTLLQAKNNILQHGYMKMHPTATKSESKSINTKTINNSIQKTKSEL